MSITTVPVILPNETSKSPSVFTENVDVESVKIFDMVKVQLNDQHGNGERIWMVILEMKMDKANEDVVLTGRIMHDLVLFDFIPKHTVIDIYRREVIDHVPFDVLKDIH